MLVTSDRNFIRFIYFSVKLSKSRKDRFFWIFVGKNLKYSDKTGFPLVELLYYRCSINNNETVFAGFLLFRTEVKQKIYFFLETPTVRPRRPVVLVC